MSDQYIITTSLRAERDSAHQAILAIWSALQGCHEGVLDGADLDETIYSAVALLPAEMRDERMPVADGNKTTVKMEKVRQRARDRVHSSIASDSFEDLGL